MMSIGSLRRYAALAPGAMVAAMLAMVTTGATAARSPATASPNPSATANSLSSVSAVSGSDAWAAGYYTNNTTHAIDTLILHWDGTTWTQVPSPSPSSTENILLGVSADSGGDAWAVGYYQRHFTGAPANPLILHWNGTTWTRLAGPHPSSTQNHLLGVSAVSGGDAWAVGWYNKTFSIEDPLIVHWNGTAWTRVPSSHPNSALINLSGVSEVSGSDVWAVGDYFTNRTNPLIMHWNGTTWTRSPSPHPSSTQNVLSGVSAVSGSDAWAVGDYNNNGAIDVLILHWNGTTWSMK